MGPELSLWDRYWSLPVLEVNLLVFANLLGALLLGLVVGYERSFHSRAAGMRTYGIVCMASAALTVFAGYPEFWWGWANHGHLTGPLDPTRVVQGIVTGIGFLCAGVIMREGFNISGLTTAASIWATSAIGVLIGVGFYAAGILLAFLTAGLMMWGSRVEARLPTLPAVAVTLAFVDGHVPDERLVQEAMRGWGYQLAEGSLHIQTEGARRQWRFVMVTAVAQQGPASLFELARHLERMPGVHSVELVHARN